MNRKYRGGIILCQIIMSRFCSCAVGCVVCIAVSKEAAVLSVNFYLCLLRDDFCLKFCMFLSRTLLGKLVLLLLVFTFQLVWLV